MTDTELPPTAPMTGSMTTSTASPTEASRAQAPALPSTARADHLQPRCHPDHSALWHLLMLGDRYLREGARRQAMDIYWSLIDDYPHEAEAAAARQRLMQVAEVLTREGMHRAARSIYEQLLDYGCESHVPA